MSQEDCYMFGHHQPAQATVLYVQDVTGILEDEHHVKMEFVLEVHPPDGQAFRAQTTHHFLRWRPYPQVGDVVNVKYHPTSRAVALELKDDIRYGEKGLKHRQHAQRQAAQARRDALRYGEKGLKHQQHAQRQAAQARRDALLAAPPGTPPASATSASDARMAELDPELRALLDLEEAERRAAQADGQL